MKATTIIQQKMFKLDALLQQIIRWRLLDKSIAFTNGCFDILHNGHIASLSQAAAVADVLIVAVNSDASTRRLKGDTRPVNNEESRALLLASLVMVDAVIVFEEDTPLTLINALQPDVLVKGGDYTIDQIVGAKEVLANGGRVVINPIVRGVSTSLIIDKITRL